MSVLYSTGCTPASMLCEFLGAAVSINKPVSGMGAYPSWCSVHVCASTECECECAQAHVFMCFSVESLCKHVSAVAHVCQHWVYVRVGTECVPAVNQCVCQHQMYVYGGDTCASVWSGCGDKCHSGLAHVCVTGICIPGSASQVICQHGACVARGA